MKANTLVDLDSTCIKTPSPRLHKKNCFLLFTRIALQFAHSNSFWYEKEERILILADFDPIEYGILCCSSLCLGFWFFYSNLFYPGRCVLYNKCCLVRPPLVNWQMIRASFLLSGLSNRTNRDTRNKKQNTSVS